MSTAGWVSAVAMLGLTIYSSTVAPIWVTTVAAVVTFAATMAAVALDHAPEDRRPW